MWYARISRRELIEIFLGGYKPSEGKIKQTTGVIIDDDASLYAYWDRERTPAHLLPTLVVVPNGEINELFAAINASPQAPSPISALCRILTANEARTYFTSAPLDSVEDILPITAALAMVEAVLHSEGRISLRQLSPAACKRTFSYAWGKALAARVPAQSIEVLPSRWIETYELINFQGSIDSIRNTVASSVNVLSLCAQLGMGIQAESQRPDDRAKRVAGIQSAACRYGLACHSETYGDTTTLQIETDDDEIALVFKLAAESALYEDHLPRSYET